MKKLAIVATHPIQYNAPWFKLLNERKVLECKVFYTWHQSETGSKFDPDFGRNIQWDIPLLEGYKYEFVKNIAKDPGSHHFRGIDNPELNKKIENWKPDAILVIGWSYKSHLKCLRYFRGRVPVLFRGDSTLLDEKKGLKVFLRRLFLKWVYSHVDKALYVGTNNKAYFLAHGLKESQLIPALHAVDNDRFAENTFFKEEQVKETKSSLNLNDEHFILLFAGKLELKKNPFFLLELAKRLPDSNMIFLIIGNGELEQELKTKAAHDKRIRFLDFQNQTMMPVMYTLASCFILPSNGPGETWGLGANEAMACGLPVILSSKVGGAVDLVRDNGIVFEQNDFEAVKNYLQFLKNSYPDYLAAKRASLTLIKKFNFTQIAQVVEKACNN